MSTTLKNIQFMIAEGCIEFNFNENETAYLQLPDTPDSQHQINNIDDADWTDRERDIFRQLSDFYFNSFDCSGCGAASAEIGATIVRIEEITYKNKIVYVAFDDEDNAHILIDSAYKNYYNKAYLFEKIDEYRGYQIFGDDYSESEIIEKAKAAYK